MRIILASQSETRAQALSQAGYVFQTAPADIMETAIIDPDPEKLVLKIAQAKARVIAPKYKKALVIAADTLVVYRNQPIGKPKFKMDALETLKTLSGKTHTVMTGWTVVNVKTGKDFSGVAQTKVTFKVIDEETLTNYVNEHSVIDWAGAYNVVNNRSAVFVEKISGSLMGFTHGLPIEDIDPILKHQLAQPKE